MSEYSKVRERALRENAQFPQDHPCVRGKAECCEGNVAMVKGDIEVVLEGIKSGAIPQSVVEAAKANLLKPDNKWCPFLDDNRDCMLRIGDESFQPIQCISYGQGGIPHDTLAFQQARARFKHGIDTSVPYTDINPAACNSCELVLKRSGACVKYSLLDGYKRIYNYGADQINRRVQPFSSTNQFVKDLIAQEAES